MRVGYPVGYGYRGLIGSRWMLFATEEEYFEQYQEWKAQEDE